MSPCGVWIASWEKQQKAFANYAIVPLRGVDCDRQLPDGVLRAARVIVPLRGVDCDGKAAQIQPRFFVQVHQKHRCYL